MHPLIFACSLLIKHQFLQSNSETFFTNQMQRSFQVLTLTAIQALGKEHKHCMTLFVQVVATLK